MSNLTIELSPAVTTRLTEKAQRHGQPLESYVRDVLEADAQNEDRANSLSRIEPNEFARLLSMLSAGLPPLPILPADYSRSDIYDEHD
jgi:hypothetical protein